MITDDEIISILRPWHFAFASDTCRDVPGSVGPPRLMKYISKANFTFTTCAPEHFAISAASILMLSWRSSKVFTYSAFWSEPFSPEVLDIVSDVSIFRMPDNGGAGQCPGRSTDTLPRWRIFVIRGLLLDRFDGEELIEVPEYFRFSASSFEMFSVPNISLQILLATHVCTNIFMFKHFGHVINHSHKK